MFVGKRQRQIDDCQQRKNESLDRSNEKVEKLDHKRHDGHAEREIEDPDLYSREDDRRDDDEEQLADEDIEEEPCRQRHGTKNLIENVDGKERRERLEDVPEIPE